MAALGLVAYDGSGSSSEDEDDQMTGGVGTTSSGVASTLGQQQKPVVVVNGAATNVNSGGGGVKSSVIFSKFFDDEEEEEEIVHAENTGEDDDQGDGVESMGGDAGANPMWSKLLPQPKKVPVEVVEEDDVEIGPIPPKKTYGDEELPQPPKPSSIPSLSSTKVKGKVRISIPFLNSLDENEEEDGEKKKIMEPSKKGSGLFAILPQPKNSFGSFGGNDSKNVFLKSKSASTSQSQPMVQNVASTSTSQDPQPSSSMRRLIPDSVKNKLKRPAPSKLDEIKAKLSKKGSASAASSKFKDSDSEDEGSGDFFSLDSTETVDEATLEKLKLPMQDFSKKPEPPVTNEEEMDVEGEYGHQNPVAGSSSRSDDLMKYIQPKRGKKEGVQIIDIKADDLRPDNTEWLKNITDESQVPARRSKGLGGMVKRKHQITYLAFEAKAREQELKNQWAQNRANKMATKNKYGF